MTVFGSHGRARTEEFAAGDVGYVPQGYGHYIENIGTDELEVVLVLNNGSYKSISVTAWLARQSRRCCSPRISACRRRRSRASPRAKPSCRSDARSP